MNEARIPKNIHYCWFGKNEKPDDVKYYIDTWKKNLPDYQIIEWNEENFCIDDSVLYVQEAYRSKKWAFVSDYVRLYALYKYGGIYFDTDVEVFQSFDTLLVNEVFFGFESNDYLTTAVIGCRKQSPIIKEFMNEYKNRRFVKKDGSLDTETTNVVALTRLLKKHGLILNGKSQKIEEIMIYPQWYFSANDFINIFGRYRARSFAHHHYSASWYDKQNKRNFIKKVRHYFLGIARNTVGTEKLYRMKHKNSNIG